MREPGCIACMYIYIYLEFISHIEHKIAIKITSDPSYKPYSILKAGRNQWIYKIEHQLVLPNVFVGRM